MRRINKILVAFSVAAMLPLLASGGARAIDVAPVFSPQERVIIERNVTLKRLVGRDPTVVRQALDAIAAASAEESNPSVERDAIMKTSKPKPTGNPDLDNLERSSPEAAHDLFQLIKKASENRKR